MKISIGSSISQDAKEARLAALLLYATLVVDLWRKVNNNIVSLPIGTTTFRNIIYVALFIAVLVHIKEIKVLTRMGVIALVFLSITLFSCFLNYRSGIIPLYIDVVFMFFSRLLPAYYLGRYLRDSDAFIHYVSKYQFFSLLYIILILAYPETSTTSYMTISNNLVLVSLLPLFSPHSGIRKVLNIGISILGLIVIVVYGGRGSLVSVFLALAIVFLFMNRENGTRRLLVIIGALILGVTVIVFYDEILSMLISLNPKSRNLMLFQRGRFLWNSNRDGYYNAAFATISSNPFKIYGFIGDRLYYAQYFGSGSDLSVIFTMFSHNVFLELLLTLSVPIGIVVIIYFVTRAIQAFTNVYKWGTRSERIVYYVLLGAELVVMIVSSSYLNDYAIWFLVGLIIYFRTSFSGGKTDEQYYYNA